MRPAADLDQAASRIRQDRFAYLPLRAMAPAMDALLEMRRLFGLRSPVNTAARLLNPADAPFGVDGVFHPPYIDVHLGVAERMGRQRLLVLKGGGGEAERVPLKPATVSVWDRDTGRDGAVAAGCRWADAACCRRGHAGSFSPRSGGARLVPATPLATIQATIALGLLATGRADDPAVRWNRPAAIWRRSASDRVEERPCATSPPAGRRPLAILPMSCWPAWPRTAACSCRKPGRISVAGGSGGRCAACRIARWRRG